MLPVLACALAHAGATPTPGASRTPGACRTIGTAQTFIDQCTRAVLDTKEGVWGMEAKDADGKLQRQRMVLRDGTVHLRVETDGALVQEALTSPTLTLAVYPRDRKFFRKAYSEPKSAKPDPLPPLAEGNMEFKISEGWGFVLRANPDFTDGRVAKSPDVETLSAVARKADGTEAVLTLVRDAKTRLPLTMRVVTPEAKADVRFLFEARKVTDEELTIAPESYAGFEEIKGPAGGR